MKHYPITTHVTYNDFNNVYNYHTSDGLKLCKAVEVIHTALDMKAAKTWVSNEDKCILGYFYDLWNGNCREWWKGSGVLPKECLLRTTMEAAERDMNSVFSYFELVACGIDPTTIVHRERKLDSLPEQIVNLDIDLDKIAINELTATLKTIRKEFTAANYKTFLRKLLVEHKQNINLEPVIKKALGDFKRCHRHNNKRKQKK